MPKSLNELAAELKALIIDLQSDPYNKNNLQESRYNNLKLSMDIAKDPSPHVVVSIAMSEAGFNIKTGEKLNGSLGPDERYVIRWFGKPNTIAQLNECWNAIAKERGRA